MNDAELAELLDLYVEAALPEALRARVEAHLTAHSTAADDAKTLRQALSRLRSAPAERPDSWFVERALNGLLREHVREENLENYSEKETKNGR